MASYRAGGAETAVARASSPGHEEGTNTTSQVNDTRPSEVIGDKAAVLTLG